MEPTRVVLADDHAIIRTSIRMVLEKAHGIEVVGEASNGVEAVQLVNTLSPDVILLDMQMPILDGVGVVRELSKSNSPVRILALSAYDDEHFINGVLEYGAAGYLTKDEAPQYVVEAVRRVARGDQGFLSKRVAAKIDWRPHSSGKNSVA